MNEITIKFNEMETEVLENLAQAVNMTNEQFSKFAILSFMITVNIEVMKKQTPIADQFFKGASES